MIGTNQMEHPLLPSDADFERMKRGVLARIDVPQPHAHQAPSKGRPRQTVPRRRILATVGVAAGVLTLALVAANVLSPGGAASAEASEVLKRAASAAITATDPAVGPEQFLLVETDSRSLGVFSTAAVLDQQERMLYIPGDADASWYLTVEWLKPDSVLGDRDDKGLIDYLATFPFEEMRHYRGEDGAFGGKYAFPTATDFADMPRDPEQLLEYLKTMPSEEDADSSERAFRAVHDALITGMVPADLRAAMYQALAQVPGVYLSEGVADLEGREGSAISYRGDDGYSVEQLIIDPTTGEFIGVREVTSEADGIVPAGTVVDSSAVTRVVVDEVPAGEYVVPPEAG